jgi:6-pyruvoyltetrahydropterin/6-carboxytetrahydropterin synthase
MFSLGVCDHVMIAHSFAHEFFGPAQRLHGATYGVELELSVRELGKHHVVMDIGALRSLLRGVLDAIDYRNLDEHPAFVGRFSTTERVAEHIALEVASLLRELRGDGAPPPGASLRVVVRESPVAYASFERAV